MAHAPSFEDLTISARRLWHGERMWDGPLAFIDLDRETDGTPEIALPPCPVVGIGDSTHPLALKLDAVIEPPVTPEAVMRQVLAMPRAAAVVVDLLRILPKLSVLDGLTVESLAYAVLQGSGEHRRWLAARAAPDTDPAPARGKLVMHRTGDRLTITLAHPDSGNTIDRAMRDALHEAFSLAALDPGIAVVSLRGAGKTFSLGAELGEFGTTADPATAHAIRWQSLPARQAALCADKLETHVQGGCVGSGLELAGWSSRLTATANAWFQLPELAMGILPGAGGCVSLTRRIGRQRTALMVLSGKRLAARHALEWGLVDALVDDPA